MNILETLIQDYSQDNLSRFFRQNTQSSGNYRDLNDEITSNNSKLFSKGKLIGDLTFEKGKLAIVAYSATGELTEKSSRKAQFEEAKNFLKLKQSYSLGGIFVFADDKGNFRFSFIYWQYSGKKRIPNSYTRCTYFVSTELTNKTFEGQLSSAKWADYQSLINQTFSIQAITKAFYNEFYDEYKSLADSIKATNNISQSQAENFALLFVIRLIFLGFVQKRRWLGNDTDFIRKLWHQYQKEGKVGETFYSEWLAPLFFKALSGPRDRRQFSFAHLSSSIISDYKDAPYLNGGLFRTNTLVDSSISNVPDVSIGRFIDYLFNYNFTIEENSYNDADLELNPEFLGIIFERLVNKADGAVYTPRVEVDLMCKLSLSNWLAKNTSVPLNQLYQLFFREEEEGAQNRGELSQTQKDEVLTRLKNITVCDPAVGSGAFPVGMLSILTETMQYLYASPNRKPDSDYNIKKGIIEKSLYGVEVKEWAVWITQLRLWIALFVDAPDSLRDQDEPILPSLDFKIRRGDSLVQLLGSKLMSIKFDQHDINTPTLDKLKKIAQAKSDYFYNKSTIHDPHTIRLTQITILREYLESEEHRLKSALTRAKTPSIGSNQQSLLIDEPKQTTISFSASPQEIDTLEQNIKQVQVQLKDIRDIGDHKNKEIPFIWGLEFSEIFYGPKEGFDLVIGNPPYVSYKEIRDPNNLLDTSRYKEFLKESISIENSDSILINGMSDLYTYFYAKSLYLLNANGIQTFICSNFWLNADYGVWLKAYLSKAGSIRWIIDSDTRSFSEAEINTIISIISKESNSHLIKFALIHKQFEAITSQDLVNINNNIIDENVYTCSALSTDSMTNVFELKWYSEFIKCPKFITDILNSKAGKFVKLRYISDVITGIKIGGYSRYITDNKPIHGKYLEVIKKTDVHENITINNSDSYIDLEILGSNPTHTVTPILWLAMRGERHLCYLNKSNSAHSGNYFGFRIFDESITKTMVCILNSTFTHLLTEIYGRAGFGGGAIIMVKSDLEDFKIMNPNNFTKKQFDKVFDLISTRKIRSIFEECGIDPRSETPIEEQEPKPLPDRAELDKIVFDALDLSVDERKEVYRAICRLVWNRINKAKSV